MENGSTTDVLNVVLKAKSDEYINAINQAQNVTVNFNTEINNYNKTVQQSAQKTADTFRSLKSIVAGIGIAKIVKEAETAYVTQATNELKLSAVMQQRTKATVEQIQAVKNLATEQQRLGIIGDEITLAGAQQIALYADQAKSINTLIPAMNDLIAQQNGYNATASDAVSAANVIGKALQGQTGALTRLGITLTDAQEKIMKYGDEEQRAAVLAEAIESRVGGMNAALRNTPTGQLQALKNDLGDLQEEFGATFQPFISSLMPVLQKTLQDIRPVILSVSTGIATIGSAMTQLDNPTVRTIVYVSAAAVALNKLKAAAGGTATGLLLIGTILSFIIGKFSETKEAAENSLSVPFVGAGKAADDAADSVSGFTDEVTGAEKAVTRLAGFDTITKLSGGGSGTLASKIISDEDVANALSFGEATAGIELPDLGDMGVPDIDWNALVEGAKHVGSTVAKSIFGTEEERYSALKEMNGWIEKIFGEEWSKNWQKLGAKIYTAINGNVGESNKAINSLVQDLRGGELISGWTDFWMSVGDGIFNGINSGVELSKKSMGKFVEGYIAMASGDFEKAFKLFGESLNASASLPMEVASNSGIAKSLGVSEQMKFYSEAIQNAGVFGAVDWMAEQLSSQKSKTVDNSSVYYDAQWSAIGPMQPSMMLDDIAAYDKRRAVSDRASQLARGGAPSSVINMQAVFKVDGEEIPIRTSDITVTNGLQ